MAASAMKRWRLEDKRERGPAPPLPLARVKAIAQQDESIGRMAVEANCIIARCTDAFLADLVKAAAERASATGNRRNVTKNWKTSKSAPQQMLPEDVRRAVSEEERFDFLRPILNAPQDSSGSLVAAGAKGKRKGGCNSGGAAAGRGASRSSTKKKGKGSTGSVASVADDTSDPIRLDGAAVPMAGSGSDLFALAGLDEEGQRRALLGVHGAAVSGLGGDDDEDYDV